MSTKVIGPESKSDSSSPTPDLTAPASPRGALARESGRRSLRALLVAGAVMFFAFILIRLAPGDPVTTALGTEATPEVVARIRGELGLDQNVVVQFGTYISNLVRGDLGASMLSNVPVSSIIAQTLPVTLWLIGLTVALSLLLAIPLALLVATSRASWVPYVFRSGTAVALALPTFLVGLLFLLYFGLSLGIAPISGYDPQFPGNLYYLWVPALTNAVVLVPILSRVLHSSLVDNLQEEFVETGVIRGVRSVRFLWFYMLRPSLAPTIVLLSYMMGVMIGSTVILETVFALPGIGRELVGAVNQRDYPVVQSIVLVFGVLVVILSLIGDLVARWLDPRVQWT
jgi:peptide/nickel transport system permease protein